MVLGPIAGALVTGAMSAGMRKMQGSSTRESLMGGAAAGMSKISGIPLPGKTGTALGAEKRAELDAQFPGTNPWEQMRGSPATSGAVQVERQKAKTAKELQSKELRTRENVANIGARATVMAAGAKTSASAVDSLTAKQAEPAKPTAPYKTHEMAQMILTGKEIELKTAMAKYANELALANLTKAQLANIYTSIANSVRELQEGKPGPITWATSVKLAGGAVGLTLAGFVLKRMRALKSIITMVMRGKTKRPPPKSPRGAPRPRPGSMPRGPLKPGGLGERAMPKQGVKKPRRVFPKR